MNAVQRSVHWTRAQVMAAELVQSTSDGKRTGSEHWKNELIASYMHTHTHTHTQFMFVNY